MITPVIWLRICLLQNHMNTYKDFRNNKQATAKAIKKHIEENYSSFNKEWLSNFRPVLDKLLEVFNL